MPVLAVGLPAHLHVLRHRIDALRAQPDRLGDPRPGAALPPPGTGRPRCVHGHGRADDEPRQRAGRLRATARSRHHRPAHGDLDRRAGSRDRRLAEDPKPIRLALSLHAADDALRTQIMPVNARYPLADVLAACQAHYERKHRKVFVEYVMLAGVNDGYSQAVQLAEALDPRVYKVNLIPYNPTDSPYEGSSPKAIDAFRASLEARGLDATVRLTRGRDIDAACGQLAARAA